MAWSLRLLQSSIALPILLSLPVRSFAQFVPTESRLTLDAAGESRAYLLYVPPGYQPGHPTALVLVFHGAGGRPKGMARHTGFTYLAAREGFIVAYPEGVRRRWNDGRVPAATHDDVGFIRALIDTLSARLAIDPRRIYATGISNGAMFSYRLACDLPGIFAAIAPVAGAMPEALSASCERGTPVALAAFQGTADPLVPYGGGLVAGRRGPVLSAARSVELWANMAACTGAPAAEMEPDRDPRDGMRVRRTAYGACGNGRDVELYTVEGGGHTWPGGPKSGPAVGRVTRDMDATATIWSFFSSHPKP
jgi:polyhydroxybutyrate depolymerase